MFISIMHDYIHTYILVMRQLLMSAHTYTHTHTYKNTCILSGRSRISPRRGANSPRGAYQHMILSNFPKNCMKLKEFGLVIFIVSLHS